MLDVHSRREHAGDELTERAEPRAAEHPGEEAVGQRNEHPPLPDRQERDGLQHDSTGHQSGRRFVDRIGKTEQLAHARNGTPTIPIGQLGICGAGDRKHGQQLAVSIGMALRLTVRRAAWESHIDSVAAHVDGLVPVVKGNGYGFGRATLHPLIKSLSDFVCVGTIYELDGVADRVTPIVLTPSLGPPPTTVERALPRDDRRLGRRRRRARRTGTAESIVKLQSSMRRYGATPAELEYADRRRYEHAGLDGRRLRAAPPAGRHDHDRLAEVEGVARRTSIRSSRCGSATCSRSPTTRCERGHPDRRFRLRIGTALWHGDKSFLHLRRRRARRAPSDRRATEPATNSTRSSPTAISYWSAPARRTASLRSPAASARSTSPATG